MKRNLNILFLSAGRRVELLRAFRAAYQSLDLKGRIVALDIDPLAPALQIADCAYLVPRLDKAEFIPGLLRICSREEIDLIFPLIDPDVPVLAKHCAEIEATGVKLMVVPPDAAAICGDKWQTKQFFQRLGLATAPGWRPNEFDAECAEYPLFIKPRAGSAAANTFKVQNAKELDFFTNYISDPIIEGFLSGPEITSDVICDLEKNVLAVISRRRIETRWGEVAKGVTIFDPRITDACVLIAQSLPAIGPITVQCIMLGDRPHFTEINARLGGGAPLGIAAGADWPRWFLARAAGLQENIPALGSYRTDVYMTRYDDSYFLSESDRREMASRRL